MTAPDPTRGRLHSLDGLRALAVLLVFAHHVDQGALPGGFIGVDVFFVLSGYLITYLLLSEHARYGTIDLKRFYLRRALRLYPALLIMVLVVGIVSAIDHIGRPAPDAIFAATYLTDFWENVQPGVSLFAHCWSLAVEEQFYLAWPAVLIFALGRGWPLNRLVWALIGLSVLITFTIFEAHIGRLDHIQYLPFAHIAELGSGILLATAVQRGPGTVIRTLAHPAVASLALAGLLVAEFTLKSKWWVFPADVVICWPVVASLVLYRSSVLSRAFGNRIAVWLGERSYAFYLWHYPIVIFMATHGASTALRATLGLGLTLVIVVISWEVVEQPFLRMKTRLSRAPSAVIVKAPVEA